MDSDQILVLDKGELAEYDTPPKLLERKGIFHSMVQATGKSSAEYLSDIAYGRVSVVQNLEANKKHITAKAFTQLSREVHTLKSQLDHLLLPSAKQSDTSKGKSFDMDGTPGESSNLNKPKTRLSILSSDVADLKGELGELKDMLREVLKKPLNKEDYKETKQPKDQKDKEVSE